MNDESVRGTVIHDADADQLIDLGGFARFIVLEPDGRVRELRLRVGRGTIRDATAAEEMEALGAAFWGGFLRAHPKDQGGEPEGGREST